MLGQASPRLFINFHLYFFCIFQIPLIVTILVCFSFRTKLSVLIFRQGPCPCPEPQASGRAAHLAGVIDTPTNEDVLTVLEERGFKPSGHRNAKTIAARTASALQPIRRALPQLIPDASFNSFVTVPSTRS